jgi:MoaA/NifB/PqqE/SkfB family radical SAM enzyme
MILPFEQFKKIIDDACVLQIKNIMLEGSGELLTYPRIHEVFRYIQSKNSLRGKLVIFSTNAILLDEVIATEILTFPQLMLSVSLNAARPETYQTMNGIDERFFNKVLNNIRQYVQLSNDLGRHAALRITFVIGKKNFREITEMIKLGISLRAKEIGFRPIYCQGKRDSFSNHLLDDADKKELEGLLVEALHEADQCGMVTNLHWLQRILRQARKDAFIPAWQDAYILQVHSDGSVNPHDFPYPMGNIFQKSLLNIWFSPQYLEFRTMIKERNLNRQLLPTRRYCFRCQSSNVAEDCKMIF